MKGSRAEGFHPFDYRSVQICTKDLVFRLHRSEIDDFICDEDMNHIAIKLRFLSKVNPLE